MKHGRLLVDLPPTGDDEETLELLSGAGVRVERIVSNGHVSPPGFWYDQAQDEWVMVLKGAAELEFEDGSCHEMAAGYWIMIPAHVRHRVAWTCADGPTVWLAVHSAPADSDLDEDASTAEQGRQTPENDDEAQGVNE